MKDYRIKSILRGLAIIAFAVCCLIGNSDRFADMPLSRIAVSLLLLVVLIETIIERNIISIFFVLGCGACVYQNELGLKDVNFLLIIGLFILIGVGMNLIFGKKPKINVIKNERNGSYDVEGNTEYWEDDGNFSIDNSLGQKTQYVKIQNLKKGDIDNALGSLTVYLTGSTVDADGAVLDIDNGMGSLTVYFPKEFRVRFNCDNGMGKINMHGECSQDESLPLVIANVDNGMGQIDFYFE
ncbi:LiaF transmembrane domain-containing protein [Pseudobutyrivibrio sp.]